MSELSWVSTLGFGLLGPLCGPSPASAAPTGGTAPSGAPVGLWAGASRGFHHAQFGIVEQGFGQGAEVVRGPE